MDSPPATAPAGTPRDRLRAGWRRLVAALLGFRPAVPPRYPALERWAVVAVFALSGAVGFNAVLHDGAKGQDYPSLFNLSVAAADDPAQFWNPATRGSPLFYAVNAVFVWLTGNLHSEAVCGLFNLGVNLGALWVFYRLARRFVAGGVWRLTLLTLAAFLPLRLIHGVVLAPDALTVWPLFALAATLAALTDAPASPARRRTLALSAGAILTVGVMVSATFLSALAAVALMLAQLVRRRLFAWKEAALLLALALVLPLAARYAIGRMYGPAGEETARWRWSGAVSVPDIVGLHRHDIHIFRGPPYDEPLDVARRAPDAPPPAPGPPYEMLSDHHYSYLALNHWATFTDPMNIFQYDPTDAYFGARSRRNQRLMAWSVKTAVPITLLGLGTMALLGVAAFGAGVFAPAQSRPDLEALCLLAFGWFASVVALLPFAVEPYLTGAWAPRLTMPALLLFLLLGGYVLERLLPERAGRVAAWVALGCVVGQSALQVAFLWPWGKM